MFPWHFVLLSGHFVCVGIGILIVWHHFQPFNFFILSFYCCREFIDDCVSVLFIIDEISLKWGKAAFYKRGFSRLVVEFLFVWYVFRGFPWLSGLIDFLQLVILSRKALGCIVVVSVVSFELIIFSSIGNSLLPHSFTWAMWQPCIWICPVLFIIVIVSRVSWLSRAVIFRMIFSHFEESCGRLALPTCTSISRCCCWYQFRIFVWMC